MPKKIIILLTLILSVVTSFAADNKKNILVVCPYSLSGGWAAKTLDPITNLDKDKVNVSFCVMRNSSFKNVDDLNEHEQGIFRMFYGLRPDLIIIFGPGNYILAEDFNKKWKGVPMVLIGELNYVCEKEYVCDSVTRKDVERVPMKNFAYEKNMTFIYTPVYPRETVELMLSALPNMKNLYFLGGEEFVSREIELEMAEACSGMGKNFIPLHPDDTKYSDLANIASAFNRRENGFVYCNWPNKEGDIDPTEPSRGVKKTLERTVPVFNTYYDDIDGKNDIAGFVSYDHSEICSELQSVIYAVVEGNVEPKNIEFEEIKQEKPVLNYEVLQRMGLNPKAITADVEFFNVPKTIWQKYNVSFLILAILALALLSLVFFYLYKKQKQLLNLSNRYYALINNAPFNYNSSKLLFDKDGNVRDIVTNAVNLTLEKSEKSHNVQFGAKTIGDAYPMSAPELIRQINEGRKRKQKAIRFTFELKEFDCYYEMLVLLDNSDVIHIFSLNMTELMHAQKELQQAKDKAVQADQMKTAFVQNVSHEIRTPLNAVIGFAQLLALPDDIVTQEEKNEYVEYIRNNSEMLMMLVNDILSVGDIERGHFPIEIGDVLCNSACNKAAKTVETRVPAGVNLYFTTEVDDDFMIRSDSKRIQQVLVNFLTNACKHTEKGEIHVHCSVTENPGKVTFSVADTGTGVPIEMAEKIFDRFTKLNEFKQGVGLGLNICRNVAKKLNGEVKLDTSYTGGARFVFIVPSIQS